MAIERYKARCAGLLLLGGLLIYNLPAAAQVSVVNMVPATNSGETARDSEPSLTGDTTQFPLVLVGTAFTPDPNGSLSGVLYFSTDGGQTWNLTNAFIPGSAQAGGCVTTICDITPRFGLNTSQLYLGYLAVDALNNTDLQVGSVSNVSTAGRTFTPLETRNGASPKFPDQPWVQATTVLEGAGAGTDHTYVANNDTDLANNTATVDTSLNPVPPPPSGFNPDVIDTTNTCNQDGASIRPAVHLDGTVYVAFTRWTGGGCTTGDIVVVRDDNFGTGPSPYQALKDSITHTFGQRVATGTVLSFGNLGNQRVGFQELAIAVDPSNSRTVYVAWADGLPPTLHVRRSIDAGQSWGADLHTVASAINPGLAINSQGKVGFLYQALGNPGTGNRWRTHLERTTNGFTTVQDLILADVPDQKGAGYAGSNPIGDYDNLVALGKDFYGIFSGFNTADKANFPNDVTYARYSDFTLHQLYADAGHTIPITDSIDPFFFHVTELTADQDFYVRDWTNSSSVHDFGQEPSTNSVFWATSDVWNKATNTPGTPDPNDVFPTDNMQAGTGSKGDNFAFVRVSRNATGSTGQVTAHFLVSPFGTGSNFQDAGGGPDPILNFANGDTKQVLASGFQWHQDPTASTHACIAAQISTANDPFIPPGLAGTAPGWPSGIAIVEDKNKAQRNIDVSHNLADSTGIDFALIHNAAFFERDLALRYESPAAEQLQGAQIVVVGGETQPFRNGGTITLPKMQPGESRWIGVRLKVPAAGNAIPVNFFELDRKRVVNGFTVLATPVSMDDAIRDNLKDHAAAFDRVAAAFGISAGKEEANAASQLLGQSAISTTQYIDFLKQHLDRMSGILSDILKKGAGGDPFQTQQTLTDLRTAVTGGNTEQSVSNHSILLHEMDGFSTMLQKQQGDPSDILQMVRWQEDLYRSRPALTRLDCSGRVVKESQDFIADWAKVTNKGESYSHLLHEVSGCFKQTAEALEKHHEDLEKAADAIEDITEHHHPLASIEQAHRTYLLELQAATQ